MSIQISELINWLIVGAIAGGFVGMLLTGRKQGYGWPNFLNSVAMVPCTAEMSLIWVNVPRPNWADLRIK